MAEATDVLRSRAINAAIVQYLSAVERGEPHDRQAFLDNHAALASELGRFLADYEALLSATLRSWDDDCTAASGGSTASAATAPLPRMFGPFELVEEIARGGMGIVYKARQAGLNRTVALKMILAGQLASAAEVERFYAEAQAAATLDHPHIVPVFEVGAHEGQHYFTMALVEGESLAGRLVRGPLPVREAAAIVRDVALAADYAHQHGVVHRDLKPANILIDAAGQVRVSDFGLAKREADASGLTLTGQVLGTPSFMAPEQIVGPAASVGPTSDVYSLGATLYAFVTGRPPFRAASTIDTLRQVVDNDPAPPSQLDANVPRDLENITLKCLEKSPDRRYATARALADDLQRFLAHEPVAAHRPAQLYRLKKFVQRNKWGVLAALVAAMALAGGFIAASLGYVQARRQARLADLKAAERQQVVLFLKDTLQAVGLPHESELTATDQLFDDAALVAAADKNESARLLRLRSTLKARIGRWNEATADCLKANELAIDGGQWSFDAALLLLKAGLDDDYRQVCSAYLARVAGTEDAVAADMAAKVSLLLPVSGKDFDRACALADFAATATEPAWHLPCVRLGKSLAEHRRGRYESAQRWAVETRASSGVTPRYQAAACFIDAAASARLGQHERARAAIRDGDAAMGLPYDAFSNTFGDTWCDRSIAERLREEAVALLAPAD